MSREQRNMTAAPHRTPDTGADRLADGYERPEITDFGSLRELTLSGVSVSSDMFGGSSGGGS